MALFRHNTNDSQSPFNADDAPAYVAPDADIVPDEEEPLATGFPATDRRLSPNGASASARIPFRNRHPAHSHRIPPRRAPVRPGP